MLYEYKVIVTDVHDGDTFRGDVDLGFKTWLHDVPFRLNRINTPELADKSGAGRVSKLALQGYLPVGEAIIVRTIKDKEEKYGRMLADLYLPNDKLSLVGCINDKLVKDGFAKYWDGKGVKPV